MAGGPSVQGQVLEMTVVGCYNLSNKEWFSRQDPYVVIEYSGQKLRTRTDTDGGRNPSFNESFKFALIDGLREMTVSVWNSNRIDRDDYIGTTKILLSKVIETGYDDTQWSLINSRSGKSSGMLKLILHFAGAKTKPAEVASATAGYYGQGPPAYGQGPPAYGQGVPACGATVQSHYPPQQPYPPPSGGYGPPPAAAQSYMPIYEAPTAASYPPQPVAYIGAQSSYYLPPSAPPMYPPAVYSQYRY